MHEALALAQAAGRAHAFGEALLLGRESVKNVTYEVESKWWLEDACGNQEYRLDATVASEYAVSIRLLRKRLELRVSLDVIPMT